MGLLTSSTADKNTLASNSASDTVKENGLVGLIVDKTNEYFGKVCRVISLKGAPLGVDVQFADKKTAEYCGVEYEGEPAQIKLFSRVVKTNNNDQKLPSGTEELKQEFQKYTNAPIQRLIEDYRTLFGEGI